MPTLGLVTASAVVLQTLAKHRSLSTKELVDLCMRRGLRAGALDLPAGIGLLTATGLVRPLGPVNVLTDAGSTALTTLRGSDEPTPEFRYLLTSLSVVTPSTRVVAAAADVKEDGRVSDPRGIAQDVMREFESAGLVSSTNGAWALAMPGAAYLTGPLLASGTDADEPRTRDAVGDRGEILSIRFERDRTGREPLQVSLMSPIFGFDLMSVVDDTDASAYAVEVKASRGQPLALWSRHEARTAAILGDGYELQVWGEIVLDRDPAEEFRLLRARGYPIRLRNPAGRAGSKMSECLKWVSLATSRWTAQTVAWQFDFPANGSP